MPILRTKPLGVFTALVTVSIWAAFLVGTRFAVSGNFTVEEVLILRLAPAAIIMIPLMIKFGVMPHGQGWIGSFAIMFGASAVFPFLISQGLFFAPASDAGALAPGMLPFWTALAAFALTGEMPDKRVLLGLGIILSGALMIGLWQSLSGAHEGAWMGYLFFLFGSGLWSIYSVLYRRSGISPVHGLVIGLFWGALLVVPVTLATGNVTFANAEWRDIVMMIFLQSIVIAIFAMVLFSYAVKQLGAPQTAAFGALTPVLALLGGVFFLGESISVTKIIGVGLVAGGVLLASGVLTKNEVKK
jgi:drug/metabolite transporter (DMT)-like permease